jgi:DNA-binding NtrC family response regulator
VRELRNMLEQTVLLAQDAVITAEQLAICSGLSAAADRESDQELSNGSSAIPRQGMKLSDMERDLVARTLDKTDWNVSKSAKLLGLSRDMLRYRIEKYGLVRPNE